MKECCHALGIFFKLNGDHFTMFACGVRGKLASRLLDRKQELVSKFSKWTIQVISLLK